MYKPEYEWIQAPRTWFNSVVFNSLRLHELQHTRPPCPSPTPRVYPNSCPLSQWCHLTISSSVSPSPPAFNISQHQGLFKWVSSVHQVGKILEFQIQHQFFKPVYCLACGNPIRSGQLWSRRGFSPELGTLILKFQSTETNKINFCCW